MRRLLLTTGLCLLCLVGIAFSAPYIPGNDPSLRSSEEEEPEWPSGEDSECEEYGACGPLLEDYSSEEEFFDWTFVWTDLDDYYPDLDGDEDDVDNDHKPVVAGPP